MEALTTECLKKIILMDMNSTNGLTVESMKESGGITKCMMMQY